MGQHFSGGVHHLIILSATFAVLTGANGVTHHLLEAFILGTIVLESPPTYVRMVPDTVIGESHICQ